MTLIDIDDNLDIVLGLIPTHHNLSKEKKRKEKNSYVTTITLSKVITMLCMIDNIMRIFFTFGLNVKNIHKILSVPHNILMALNNVMTMIRCAWYVFEPE